MSAQINNRYQLQKSLAIKETIGDKRGIASSLGNLGLVAYRQRDYVQARRYFEQTLAIFQNIGNKRGIAIGLHDLGGVAYHQGEFEQARDYLQQSLAIQKHSGAQSDMVSCYNRLGFVYLKLNPEQALQPFLKALTLAHAIQVAPLMLETLVGFAWLYLQRGNPVRARKLVGLALLASRKASMQVRPYTSIPGQT